MSSVFDRVNPDNLLSSDGEGGYKSPVGDGFVNWDEKTQNYKSDFDAIIKDGKWSDTNFLNYNEQTGTYESKDQQKSREQYPTPPLDNENPYSFPHVRGSAVSVQSKLKNITFVKGTSGGMSGSIAYIRYWSRNGVGGKKSISTESVNGAPADSQQELSQQLSSSYLAPTGTLNIPESSEPLPFRTSPPGRSPGGDIPTNTSYQESQGQPETTTPAGPSVFDRLGNALGKLFSANPGNAVDPATAIKSYTYAEAPEPDNAVWQFLFNPEELNLSSGPDYNRAETWGVSDPLNSGQPLSWRSNKNRKLTFGKVLLHGYTFGKRVDSLENGLQQLFMARDGNNGSDGPPVLEFVWGQRFFGPCVIQNIQVREQAWDKGLLVNAEVSFELEQVPEWTINDGFVDVVRPGRQSTVNDPFLPRSTPDSTETPMPKDTPGGGNPKPVNLANCVSLYDQRKLINDIEFITVRLKNKPLLFSTQRGADQGLPLSNKNWILKIFDSFILTPPVRPGQAVSEARKKAQKIIDSRECKSETYRQSFEYDIDQAYQSGSNVSNKIKNIDNYYTDFAIKCIRSYKKLVDEEISELKCSSSPYRTPTGGRQGPGLF